MATEAELALALHNALISDPKTRNRALKLIKEKFPQAPIPEIDAAAPIETELGALGKKLDTFIEQMKNEKVDSQIAGKFSALRSARGYTDEGIESIKKLMVDKSIADPDAAADHFDRLNYKPTPIEPSGWQSSSMLNEKDEGVKSWLEDPDGMTDRIIGEVLTEARQGKLI